MIEFKKRENPIPEFEEMHNRMKAMFIAMCEALYFPQILNWLSKRLNR